MDTNSRRRPDLPFPGARLCRIVTQGLFSNPFKQAALLQRTPGGETNPGSGAVVPLLPAFKTRLPASVRNVIVSGVKSLRDLLRREFAQEVRGFETVSANCRAAEPDDNVILPGLRRNGPARVCLQLAHPGIGPVFSPFSPKGAASEASVENKLQPGWGEEAQLFPAQIPSTWPSPRSDGEREREAVSKCARLQLAAICRVFLFVTGASLLAGCCALPTQPQQTNAAGPKPKWHSIVMTPRTNLPAIHFYDKLNPIWWLGNVDEPQAPAWYRPNARTRNFTWYLRNPYSNFSNYVIGIADKKSVRSGRYPDKIGNPHGGWNFAVSRRGILYLPFIDYKHGRFEFYSGWRQRGNFGIKLNLSQKLPGPRPQNDLTSPPAVPPQSDDKPKSSPDSKPALTP